MTFAQEARSFMKAKTIKTKNWKQPNYLTIRCYTKSKKNQNSTFTQ